MSGWTSCCMWRMMKWIKNRSLARRIGNQVFFWKGRLMEEKHHRWNIITVCELKTSTTPKVPQWQSMSIVPFLSKDPQVSSHPRPSEFAKDLPTQETNTALHWTTAWCLWKAAVSCLQTTIQETTTRQQNELHWAWIQSKMKTIQSILFDIEAVTLKEVKLTTAALLSTTSEVMAACHANLRTKASKRDRPKKEAL